VVPMKTWMLLLPCVLALPSCATAVKRAQPDFVAQDAKATQDAQTTPTTTTTQTTTTQTPPAEPVEEARDVSVGHALLWYIPNRISDILDIVRARLRLGPGLAVGARVTELLDFNIGGYGTVWIGIPGPRRSRTFNWPVGFESMAGAEFLWWDGTTHGHGGPHYGAVEVGLGAQVLLAGADLGVDVWEAVDFLAGIIFLDPVHDDI
jgi:hypothetical protein